MNKKYLCILFLFILSKNSLSSSFSLTYLIFPSIYSFLIFKFPNGDKNKINLPLYLKEIHNKYKLNFFRVEDLPCIEQYLLFNKDYIEDPTTYVSIGAAGIISATLGGKDTTMNSIKAFCYGMLYQGVLGGITHYCCNLINGKKNKPGIEEFKSNNCNSYLIGSLLWKNYISQYIQYLYNIKQNKETTEPENISIEQFANIVFLDGIITEIEYFLKSEPYYPFHSYNKNIVKIYKSLCNCDYEINIENQIEQLMKPAQLLISIKKKYYKLKEQINTLVYFDFKNLLNQFHAEEHENKDTIKQLEAIYQALDDLEILMQKILCSSELKNFEDTKNEYINLKETYSDESILLDPLFKKEIKFGLPSSEQMSAGQTSTDLYKSLIQSITKQTEQLKKDLSYIYNIKSILDQIANKKKELDKEYYKNIKLIHSLYLKGITFDMSFESIYNYNEKELTEYLQSLFDIELKNKQKFDFLFLINNSLRHIYKLGEKIYQDLKNIKLTESYKNCHAENLLKKYEDQFSAINDKYMSIHLINLSGDDYTKKVEELSTIFKNEDQITFNLYEKELQTAKDYNNAYRKKMHLIHKFYNKIIKNKDDLLNIYPDDISNISDIEIFLEKLSNNMVENNKFIFIPDLFFKFIINKLISKIEKNCLKYYSLFDIESNPTESTLMEKEKIISTEGIDTVIFEENLKKLSDHSETFELYKNTMQKYLNKKQIDYIQNNFLNSWQPLFFSNELIENFFYLESQINIKIEQLNIHEKILVVQLIYKLQNFLDNEQKNFLNVFSQNNINYINFFHTLDQNYCDSNSEYNTKSIEKGKQEIELIFNSNHPYYNMDIFSEFLCLNSNTFILKQNLLINRLKSLISEVNKNNFLLFLKEVKTIKKIIDKKNQNITKFITSLNDAEKACFVDEISNIEELIKLQNSAFEAIINMENITKEHLSDFNLDPILQKIIKTNNNINNLRTKIEKKS